MKVKFSFPWLKMPSEEGTCIQLAPSVNVYSTNAIVPFSMTAVPEKVNGTLFVGLGA